MSKMVNNLVGSIKCNSDSGFNHYSGIYKNGKPFFTGCNSLRNVYNGKNISYSTHAEMDVLYKMLKVEARTTI